MIPPHTQTPRGLRRDSSTSAGLALILCVTLLAGWRVHDDYQHALEDARRLLLTQAQSGDEQISGALRAAHLFLGDLAAEHRKTGDAETLESFMRLRTQAIPEMGVALLATASGTIWAATAPDILGFDASSREYFRAARDAPGPPGIRLHQPFQTTRGTRVVAAAIALRSRDGEFQGVAALSLPLSFFDSVLRSILPGDEGAAVRLGDRDGVIYYGLPEGEALSGTSVAQAPGFQRHMADGERATILRTRSVLDHRDRLMVLRTLERGALILNLSLPMETVLASWRKTALGQGLAVAAIVLTTGFLMAVARRRRREAARAEARMAEVQAFNQDLFAQSPVGLAAYTRDGTCIQINDAAARILEAGSAQADPLPFRDVEGWAGISLGETARAVLDSGEPRKIELQAASGPGRGCWYACTLARIQGGGVPFLLLFLEDVTKRKQAEAAQAHMLAILEAARDLIASSDREGNITYLNAAGRRILDLPEDEALGETTLSGLYPPATLAALTRDILPLAAQRGYWEGETELKSRSGRIIPASQIIVAHPGPDRAVAYYSTIARDITERKRAERELAATDFKYQDLYGKLLDGMAVVDLDGRFKEFNASFAAMIGYEPRDILSLTIQDITPPEWIQAEETIIREQVLVQGHSDLYQKEFCRQDGSIFPVELRTYLQRDPAGRPTGMWTLVRDITERKKGEEALLKAREEAVRADRAKSEFLANMSHEIRTPMNAILGLCHLTQQTGLTPLQSEYMAKLRQSADALLSIINDILDVSKIEAGRMEMAHAPFALDAVFEALGDTLALKAEEKGLDLLFRLDPALPAQLVGDTLRLRQVLLNLAVNAIKFTEKGEVEISAESADKTPGRIKVRFRVRDTGIGIDQEQVGKLFQAFTQVDESMTRRFGGTGLGLAICRRLVQLMDGEIHVTSVPGSGSTFHFTCWFGQAAPAEARLPQNGVRGARILVASGSATGRDILCDHLRAMSFRPQAVSEGGQALEALALAAREGQPFGLLLVDWRLPDMTGARAVAALRALPGMGGLPVLVMVTGYSRQEAGRELAGLPGVDTLPKPTLPAPLFDAVQRLLEQETTLPAYRPAQPFRPPAPVRPEGPTQDRPVSGSPSPAPARHDTAGEVSPSAMPRPGAHVLVVEDNSINRQVARELLRTVGLHADLAEGGEEALALVRTATYDAVLMDIQMPGMDGYETSQAIQAFLGSATPPIIAMTAHAMDREREKCAQAGMSGFITKPVEPDELYAVLARWVGAAPPGVRPDPGPDQADRPALAAFAALPVLPPGFVPEEGLARSSGNQDLYRRMLLEFTAEFGTAPARLRDLAARGDLAEAARLAHALKGVAGNLGGRSVAQAAQNIQEALEAGQPLDALLAALAREMDMILAALAPLREDAPPPDAPQASPDALRQARALLDELVRLTDSSSLDADRQLPPLRAALASTRHMNAVRELERAVAAFRYEQANALARGLLAALGPDQG